VIDIPSRANLLKLNLKLSSLRKMSKKMTNCNKFRMQQAIHPPNIRYVLNLTSETLRTVRTVCFIGLALRMLGDDANSMSNLIISTKS
jgi:hypothetical protein